MRLRCVGAVLVISTVSWAMPLGARDGAVGVVLTVAPKNVAIDTAQKQIDAGDFEEAVRTLEEGIGDPDLSDEQLVEMYRLLGLASLYLGNQERAREAFEKLLQARPDYEVPKSASPRIREVYARIRDDIKKRRVRPVTVTLTPIGDVGGDEEVHVEARIEDMALGAKCRLFYRRVGANAFSYVDFTRDRANKSDYHAAIPGFEVPKETAAYDVEYYLEVSDAAKRRLAGKGDPFNAMRFRVASTGGSDAVSGSKDVPFYKSPWFWVGLGVGVAAVGATVAIVATQKPTGAVPITIQVTEQP